MAWADGGAGAVERVGRDAGQELREEADLARDVGREDRRDHLAEDHLVHFPAVDLAAEEQLARGVPRQGHGGDVPERGPALHERRSHPGDDGDPTAGPGCWHVAPGERGTYFFTARTLATARHRSASTASTTSRPCRTVERRDQPGQLTGTEQVIVRGRTPAKLALGAQERLHHQEAARLDQLDHLGHLGPVKIIEHENRIKSAELAATAPPGLPASSRWSDPGPRPARAPRPAGPRRGRPPSTRAPRAAAARLWRPSPQARSSTRAPGPTR